MQLGGIEHISLLDTINALGKVSIVLAIAVALQSVIQISSAERRALVVRASLFYLSFAPIFVLSTWDLLPRLEIEAPLAISAVSDRAMDIPTLPQLAYRASETQTTIATFNITQVLLWAYSIVASVLLLNIALSVYRLFQTHKKISASQDLALDPARFSLWLEQLEQLKLELGLDRGVELFVSDRVTSPISWGIWRHTIVIDLHSFGKHHPDHILKHELAHITNHDWLSVIVMRIICAVYWFHPMIWLLQKHFRYQLECAADDTVLRHGGRASDYAQTLIDVSRAEESHHSFAMRLAAKGNSLYQRILNILNTEQARAPVTRRDWMSGIFITIIILIVSASFSLVGEKVQWPQKLFESSLSHQAAPHQVVDDVIFQLEALQNPSFHALAQAMKNKNFEERRGTSTASFKQRRAIPILILALHDEDPVVRRLALWGLSEMQFYETLPVIELLLKDTDATVRAEAAGAIGDFADASWSTKLHPILSDSSPLVRQRVAHALGDIANPLSLKPLQHALHDPKNQAYPELLHEIRWALQEIQE